MKHPAGMEDVEVCLVDHALRAATTGSTPERVVDAVAGHVGGELKDQRPCEGRAQDAVINRAQRCLPSGCESVNTRYIKVWAWRLPVRRRLPVVLCCRCRAGPIRAWSATAATACRSASC